MEIQTRNGLIAVGITLGIAVGGYFIYKHYTKDVGNNDFPEFKDNFESLQDSVNIKPDKNNIVTVPFNIQSGTAKNLAQFYTNNRVIIFDNKAKTVIKKGSYSNGGKTILIDGEKEYSNPSVYANLLLIVNK